MLFRSRECLHLRVGSGRGVERAFCFPDDRLYDGRKRLSGTDIGGANCRCVPSPVLYDSTDGLIGSIDLVAVSVNIYPSRVTVHCSATAGVNLHGGQHRPRALHARW